MTPSNVEKIRERNIAHLCPIHGYPHCGICAERERRDLLDAYDALTEELDKQDRFHTLWKAKAEDIAEERDRLRGLYGDMVNQFAYRVTKNGQPMISTGGLSDLEEAFAYFKLSDPCSLDQFHTALAEPRP